MLNTKCESNSKGVMDCCQRALTEYDGGKLPPELQHSLAHLCQVLVLTGSPEHRALGEVDILKVRALMGHPSQTPS